MNTKLFASAAASAVLALAMGGNAVAADIGAVNPGLRNPGVSFVDHAGKGGMKDVMVEPGVDPGTVILHFTGAQRISFGAVGTLVITKADGSVWRYKPSAWQVVNGKRKDRVVGFRYVAPDRVKLTVDKIDPSVPVMLGPVAGRNGNS